MREELRDLVTQMIHDTTVRLGKKFAITSGADARMADICDMVGDLMDKVEATNCFVEAEPDARVLTIGVVCDDMILQHGRTDDFFELIKHVGSFSFSKEGESLAIRFNIYNIWRYV